MYAQQRRLPAHSELIFARGTCFGLRSSSVQAIYFSCKWLTLGSFFVYAITITNILGGFVGLSFEEANVNSRCFALFCNGADEWSATPFLGLNSLVVIGVWLKAGLAQTNKSIGWGSGRLSCSPCLIGGSRSILFSSEIFPLLSFNDSGAFLKLLEDLSLPTFQPSNLPHPAPTHHHIGIFIPAGLMPTFYLFHHIFLSCGEMSLCRKFTQRRVYGLWILWSSEPVMQ